MDISPLIVSLKVATISTIITFVFGILAAYIVVRLDKNKSIIDCILTLPMILPPTVVGFFLLIVLGKNGYIGSILNEYNIDLAFTWKGAVIASTVVSFPLMYRAVRGAFEQIDSDIIYSARTLGISEATIFIKILVPVSKEGIIAGTVLTFARALGEFGATMMFAGNMPGQTQTVSSKIYTLIQSGNEKDAYIWVIITMAISFSFMFLLNHISYNNENTCKKRESF